MVIVTRSYCPVHSVIVVIEMCVLQPTVQYTRHCDRIACCIVRYFFCGMTQDYLITKMPRLGSSSQMSEVNTHGTSGGGAGWPGPSACVMAVGTRFYCPVNSFIVVIEMRALQPFVQHTHSTLVRNKCLLQLTAATYTFVGERDVGGREATLL